MKHPEKLVFGLDIGTRSVVGTVGYKDSKDSFTVVAQCSRLHETRAMLDGQIHDIGSVAETIKQVKKELEAMLDRKLTDVCIAAAGRVLTTAEAEAEVVFDEETVIDEEIIHSLEMLGVESAHKKMLEETKDDDHHFYCVAYTVIHYYLNNFMITNLEDHKASKIGVKVLATFLPEEVIDGLYSAVEKAGLQVENLTLEPIAAMQVAIPVNYRLLNIALVDVGAGTSDICITKDGAVAAYGMIPMAGDMLTEVIAKSRLVDFNTAETIKLEASTNKRTILYKDIMGLKQKVERSAVLADVDAVLEQITGEVAKQILGLNGQKPVSAVFVVGGGGKLPGFTEKLAKKLKLPKERVALRGEEVLTSVTFLQEDIQKDPLLVTPVGICLNYYEQRNNFIFVRVNDERIKLYDNGKLTIVDAALAYGYPKEKLFPNRGKELTFTVNGEKRMVRGELGEAAVIHLNQKIAGINAPIQQNDEITIEESTVGKPASCTIGQLPEFKQTISFTVNHNKVACPRYMQVNGEMVSEYYEIKENDEIVSADYYTLGQVLAFLDIVPQGRVYVNHVPAGADEKVYENFVINMELEEAAVSFESRTEADEEPSEEELLEEAAIRKQEQAKRTARLQRAVAEAKADGAEAGAKAPGMQEAKEGQARNLKAAAPAEPQEAGQSGKQKQKAESQTGAQAAGAHDIIVVVNKQPTVLKGKSEYRLVDVLDVHPFDLSKANGRMAVVRVNGTSADFLHPLVDGDKIEMYWEEKK